MEDLRASVHGRAMRSRAADVDLKDCKVIVDDNQALRVQSPIMEDAEPSHWSFGQFSRLLKAPADYLRTLPADLMVRNLTHGIEAAPRDSIKLMTVEDMDGGLSTLQAVTSPSYGRIWDFQVCEAAQKLIDRSGGKFINPPAYACRPSDGKTGFAAADLSTIERGGLYASDRDVFIFLIDGGSRLEAGPRAQLHRGVILSNSEVGKASLSMSFFYFNEVCGNNIIYGMKDLKTITMRHSSGAPERFISDALPNVLAFANRTAEGDEALIKRAMDYRLPSDLQELDKLIAKANITKAERARAIDFAKAEEGQCSSLWDFIQGLTAYARGFAFADSRTDLETRAGSLLDIVSGN